MAKVAADIRLSLHHLLEVPNIFTTSSSESSLVYFIFPVLLVAVTTIILTWRIVANGMTDAKRPPPPPGKLALPIIGFGDTMKFMAAFSRRETREYVAQKIKECGSPVFKTTILGRTIVFLDAPDGVKLLTSATDDILIKNSVPASFQRLVSKGWMNYRGQEFKALKNHATDHFFGLDILQRYLPIVERNVVEQIGRSWMGQEYGAVIESHSNIKTLLLGVITELCLGLTDSTEIGKLKPLFEIFSEGMFVVPVNLPGFQFYRSLQADKQIIRFLKQQITRRRKELKEGRASPNQKVYEQLIQEHSAIARSKQDNKCLTWEDLRSMKYSWRVILETMRVTPVIASIMREANNDFEYKGFTIKKGWKVWCTSAQSSQNPDLIDNPDVFDPSRFEQPGVGVPRYTYFPFGMGYRQCPGMELGKMVILVTLHHFLKNFKWSLVNPEAKILYAVLPYFDGGSLIRISQGEYF
ncbi:hypothetical protein R1flu_012031 [Riccia fluitans]|uniref:Cytochrome P450 n=1 Tax=Riccia fluitans TaxID=41844 RepID=A0ABD1Z9H3_9MARC